MCSLMKNQISVSQFIKKRVLKVLFPAIFVSVIWIVILCCFPNIPQNNFGIQKTICWNTIIYNIIGVFMFQFADSVLWFIKIIVIEYVVIYIYNSIRISNKRKYRLPVLLIMTCAVIFATNYLVAAFATVSILAFSLGVVFADYNSFVTRKINIICILFNILLVIILLNTERNLVIHGVINYFFLINWLWLSSYLDIKVTNLSGTVSSLSYDVYLTHKKVLVILFLLRPYSNSLIFYLLVSIVVASLEYYLRKIATQKQRY